MRPLIVISTTTLLLLTDTQEQLFLLTLQSLRASSVLITGQVMLIGRKQL